MTCNFICFVLQFKNFKNLHAGVVELANTLDLGSSGEILAGSSPVTRTIVSIHKGFDL